MKKLITLSAIAILGFASCKKESMTKEVTFTVGCKQCFVKINKDEKSFFVEKFYTRTVEMNNDDTAYLFAGISATSLVKMRIEATIKVGNKTVERKDVDDYGALVELTTTVQ